MFTSVSHLERSPYKTCTLCHILTIVHNYIYDFYEYYHLH